MIPIEKFGAYISPFGQTSMTAQVLSKITVIKSGQRSSSLVLHHVFLTKNRFLPTSFGTLQTSIQSPALMA